MVWFHSLSFFAIPLIVGASVDIRSGACLPRLRTHPAEFKPCETKLCLIFMSFPPYALPPEDMKKQDNQTLFKCKEREKIFPKLRGVSFLIMDKMKQIDDTYCVYAGNNCTFDGLIDLASTSPSVTWRYRLGVSGLGFILPHRIRPSLKPLVSFVEGRMALIGRRRYHVKKPDAVASMFSPFALIAWISIVGCFGLLAFLWILTVWRSSRKLRISTLVLAIVGEPIHAKIPLPGRLSATMHVSERQEYMQLSNKMALTTIRFSAKAFVAIIVILYEVTIVYYLFEQRGGPVALNMKGLSESKLGKFTFTHGDATESIFRKSVDPQGLYANGSRPWKACWPLRNCFLQVLNKTDGVELLFADGLIVRYFLAQMKLCDKLDVYQTRPQEHSYQGTWYLNTNVPDGQRLAINREIANLRMDEVITGVLEDFLSEVVPATCGQPTPPKIDGEVLGPFFAILLGPLIIVVLFSLMCGLVLKHLAVRLLED